MRFLVHHLLEASARLHPDNVAVTDGERSLTYRQLDGESNRLARVLVDIGTVRGDRVGIYLDKSIESIVAVYGAMKAGAAYVPLDPDAPPPRLNYVASDCRFRCLLTGIEKRSRWAEVTSGSAVHTLVVLNSEASDAGGTNRPRAPRFLQCSRRPQRSA